MGEEIDVRGPEVVHDLTDGLPLLAESDHDAGLREHRRIESPSRAGEAAGSGNSAAPGRNRGVEAGHRLEVVVEDVGPGFHHRFEAASGAAFEKVGRQDLALWCPVPAGRTARMVCAKCSAPPSSAYSDRSG